MPQASRVSTPTEVLAGLVERVTFHNDENGFCVLRVKARGQRDLITVTRGKRLVVLVGQRKALAIAVKGGRTRRRWSKLREWLIGCDPP